MRRGRGDEVRTLAGRPDAPADTDAMIDAGEREGSCTRVVAVAEQPRGIGIGIVERLEPGRAACRFALEPELLTTVRRPTPPRTWRAQPPA